MTRQGHLLLAASLAVALATAGCEVQEVDKDKAGKRALEEASKRGKDDPAELTRATTKQTLKACRTLATKTPGIPDDLERELKGICDAAEGGDLDDVQRASKRVCTKIAEKTLPGFLEDKARKVCDLSPALLIR